VQFFTLEISIILVVGAATAQDAAPTGAEILGRFDAYPVMEIFKGTPVAPVLVTGEQRRFRTRIR
jgi:hypothetical protein